MKEVIPILEIQATKSTNQRSTRENSKKTYQYYFSLGAQRVKVCKATFLATLGIGEKTVMCALASGTEHGQSAVNDQRGKHPPGIKKSEATQQAVKNHISSFPALESHYARSQSSRRYLEAGLNITKMYSLYKEECDKTGLPEVKESYYRMIFNSQFNLAFHHPKKDQCNFCSAYENSSGEARMKLEVENNNHQQCKHAVRELKQTRLTSS
jgi:hypothetical protein